MNTDLVILVVLGTTIWVGYDAHSKQIPVTADKPYSLNTGAVAWVFMCLLLWIVSFPYYLVRRSKVLSERTSRVAPPRSDARGSAVADLEKLGELRSKGLLTEAEFEKKKQQLLSS